MQHGILDRILNDALKKDISEWNPNKVWSLPFNLVNGNVLMMFPSSDKCIVVMEDLNNLENWMRVQGNSMHYPQHFVNTKLFQNKNIFFSFLMK